MAFGLDPKLRREFKSYLFQVSMATVAIILVLAIEETVSGGGVSGGILVAALGSTAFILFFMPHRDTARPTHVLGGHSVALAVGGICAVLVGSTTGTLFALQAGLTVGLSMFLMAATNTEHPPAAGTALAMVAHGFSINLALFFVLSIGGLVIIHSTFRRYMKDLY